MNIWGKILHLCGWSVHIDIPVPDKCVICVAPHTSNLDFLIGLAAWRSLGRKADFLMKESWFFFPLKYLLEHLGGIPVPRHGKSSLTAYLTQLFKTRDNMNLAVTPEGTRSAQAVWHKGFLYVARDAGVPVLLGLIDFKNKRVVIDTQLPHVDNVEADLKRVKTYYRDAAPLARYPDKFISNTSVD